VTVSINELASEAEHFSKHVASFIRGRERMPMARTRTVLLVTKPGLVRNVTSAGLTLSGYDVLTAAPEEAIECLQVNRHTAVVVIDADLPDQDEGVARFARAINPKVDVVYTSRVPHRAAATLLPGAPILRDPYHPHQLANVIAHLRSRPAEPTDASAA
jgi:CheY-like chemotaxis protein